MSTAGILSVIAWASVATSFVMFVNVLRLHGHAWKQAGRWKWLWALLSIVSFFALLSIPVALWYFSRIRPAVAAADADCIAARRSRRPQAAGRVYAVSSGQGACKWCRSGMRPCDACRPLGSGFKGDLSRPYCYQCSGSGEVKCTVCAGTGLA
jgi:hypothetical protein